MQIMLTRDDDGCDSVLWALEVHLKVHDTGIYHSAILYGNEDSPDRIDFYTSPDPLVSTPVDFTWRSTSTADSPAGVQNDH